jgi:hypothetical protein
VTRCSQDLDAEMISWFMDEKIKLDDGYEIRITQGRGLREETYSRFYDTGDQFDLSRTKTQIKQGDDARLKQFSQLYGQAIAYLRSEGEANLIEFFKSRGDAPQKLSPFSELVFVSDEWVVSIYKSHGPASKAAFAARFMNSFADLYKQKQGEKDWFVVILRLCQSWYLWNSECTGEHVEAFWSNTSPLNLKKAGAARAKKSKEKLLLLEEYLEKFWLKKPNYRQNANKTAAFIHDDFCYVLRSNQHRPYSKTTLEKHIGTIAAAQIGKCA